MSERDWVVLRWRTGREYELQALGPQLPEGGEVWFPEVWAWTKPRGKHKAVRYQRPAFPGYAFLLGRGACLDFLRTHPSFLGWIGRPGPPEPISDRCVEGLRREFAAKAAAPDDRVFIFPHAARVIVTLGPLTGYRGRAVVSGPERTLVDFRGTKVTVATAHLQLDAGLG